MFFTKICLFKPSQYVTVAKSVLQSKMTLFSSLDNWAQKEGGEGVETREETSREKPKLKQVLSIC